VSIYNYSIKILFLALLALGVAGMDAHAQNTRWNGSVSTDWFNAANWSKGVPTSNSKATIGYISSGNFEPIITANTTIDQLRLGSNSQTVKIASGVTLTVNDDIDIGNSATLDVGNGHLIVKGETDTGGNILVDGGSITFEDEFEFDGGGTFTVNTGSVNMNDEFKQGGNSTFNLGSGTITIKDDTEFEGSATFNAGSGTINLDPPDDSELEFNGGSSFNSDSSTVNISGEVEISSSSNQDVTFHNLNIEDGAEVTADLDVTVNNNMDVGSNSDYNQEPGTNLNVVGDVTGEPQVSAPAPYITKIEIINSTTIKAIFNMALKQSTATSAGNYMVKSAISASSTVLDNISTSPVLGGSNNNEVTITFDNLTIAQSGFYYLHVKNVENTSGKAVNDPHVKRFGYPPPPKFYSRTNGDWNSNSTWSTVSHTGPAANKRPANTQNSIAIIGNGNTVTVASGATLNNVHSVNVQASSKLLVDNSGVLQLRDKVITGDGTFEVGSGKIGIGSPDGITSSGAAGNIQTTSRIFSTSGSYVYNGSAGQITGNGLPATVNNLDIDNAQNVRLTDNVEVTGTLDLSDGSLVIPSGKNLIANTKNITSGNLRMERMITGSTGWRLLSSPLSTAYEDLLDKTITQGYSGAYYSTGSNPGDTLQPNVMWYDETYHTNSAGLPATDNDRWRAPASASTNLTPGRGLYTFIFGDIDADPLYNDKFPLPINLIVQGQENEGNGTEVDLNVSYTAAADSGWNLVGNPFAASINWDDVSNWTKTNIDQTIYVWDPAATTFRTWNGSTGDLPSQGLIAPFQGFWVKANAANPSLKVGKEAKTFGGTFVGKAVSKSAQQPKISIHVRSKDGHEAATHLMFSENAKLGKDPYDAYQLVPPPGIQAYVSISTSAENGTPFAINNLPRHFGKTIEIPVYVDAYKNGFSSNTDLELSFQKLDDLPAGWSVQLRDNRTKAKIDLNHTNSYSFVSKASSKRKAPNYGMGSKPKIAGNHNSDSPRFTIIISPGEDAADLPSSYKLEQNYPNPFNPTTNIQFDLPLQTYTELTIFDMLGRKVETLVSKELQAGTHTYIWNAAGVSSGIYLYRLVTSENVTTKKMTLIK
jgi:hypothetical protein